jgi:hypothetical protein
MNSRIFWELNEAYQLGVCTQVDEEVLNEEELVGIQEWVEALIEEGYDLDEYTDDELYGAYLEDLDEAKADSSLTPLQKIRKRNKEGNLVMSAGDQTGERRSYHKAGRGEKKEKGDKYDAQTTVGKDKWTREAEVKKSYGSQYSETGRRERNIRAIKSQEKVGGAKGLPEEVDLYDIVSEYLVSEGFCESYEDADVIMANMSEEWRESILDEAVRGSGRSIGNMITGNDIRSVSRSDGKSVYKKPKQNDKIETNVRREVLGIKLRAQGGKEYKNDLRDRERQATNSKSIKRLNAIKNAGVKHGDHKVDFTTSDSNSGYREVPTDYRARKRRASGR